MTDENAMSARDEDSALLAEYALGVLPPGDHAALRDRLRAEPALRAELAGWRRRLSPLDAGFAEASPPRAVWRQLERRLFAGQPGPGWWNALPLWRALAAIATAIAVVAIAFNLAAPRPDPEAFAARLVAALSAEGSDVSFVALYDAASGELRLTAMSGAAVPDRDYELWAIAGDAAPRSLGVVPVDASVQFAVPADILVDFGEGTLLAVTLEQRGGSPTGVPQGPVVAAGPARQI